MTVLEAMAAGVPVLAPRLGGLPELLGDDASENGLVRVKNGWLYGPRDELPPDDELAQALLAVVASESGRRQKPSSRRATGGMARHAEILERIYGG